MLSLRNKMNTPNKTDVRNYIIILTELAVLTTKGIEPMLCANNLKAWPNMCYMCRATRRGIFKRNIKNEVE